MSAPKTAGSGIAERLTKRRNAIMQMADDIYEMTQALTPDFLEEVQRRLEVSQYPDGHRPSSLGNVSGGSGSTPTEAVGLIRFPDPRTDGPDGDGTGSEGWRPQPDPQRDAVRRIDGWMSRLETKLNDAHRAMRSGLKDAESVDHSRGFLLHVADKRREHRAGTGYCRNCPVYCSGSANDRLRAGGLCNKCRMAWTNDGQPDLALWILRNERGQNAAEPYAAFGDADDNVQALRAEDTLPPAKEG